MSERTVTGLFHDAAATCDAVDALLSKGFGADDLGILMTESTRAGAFTIESASEAGPSPALTTGVAGALLADIVSTAFLVMPGFGFLVAGPLVAVMMTDTESGAGGPLAGRLACLGFRESEALFVESELAQGGILIGVRTTPRNVGLAKSVLRRHGGNALKAA